MGANQPTILRQLAPHLFPPGLPFDKTPIQNQEAHLCLDRRKSGQDSGRVARAYNVFRNATPDSTPPVVTPVARRIVSPPPRYTDTNPILVSLFHDFYLANPTYASNLFVAYYYYNPWPAAVLIVQFQRNPDPTFLPTSMGLLGALFEHDPTAACNLLFSVAPFLP